MAEMHNPFKQALREGRSQIGLWVALADESLCVLVQVESARAIANVAAITAVDGVDGVFFGPSDLAASMGHLGNAGHPEVQRAIETGIASVRAAKRECLAQAAAHLLDWCQDGRSLTNAT